MSVVLKTELIPATLAHSVKNVVGDLDSSLPIYQVKSMSELVAESLSQRRFAAWMLSLFAALALALGAIGIYGLMGYLVTQGVREIGIRIALGATQGVVKRMILRHALAVIIPGSIVGLGAAIALAPFLRSLLFGVSLLDPVTLCGIPALLMLTALIAVYVPARRAAAVDPMVALRCD
jgi:ABC-type antimicrobial peptide transport system permease subunit